MDPHRSLPLDTSIAAFEAQAAELLEAVRRGDGAAHERFKWEHPRFRERPLSQVHGAELDLGDARVVVAHEHGFDGWRELVVFTEAVHDDGPVRRFEEAVEAVVAGETDVLRSMLEADPELARARSTRRHHATLLHYLAANGVERTRQRTPPTAVAVAQALLEAGADPDALADAYGERCTTMSLLVSSTPPAEAGLQIALAETLLDHGAALVGPGSRWTSTIMTALLFGFPDTAEAIALRVSPPDDLPVVAGLGRTSDVERLLPGSDGAARHLALALAAQLGRAEVVRLLLDAGEDPDRFNPEGCHAHSTPLHQAVAGNHADVVRLLVERGARLDLRDRIFEGTPLSWAEYLGKDEIAEHLRSRGAEQA